METDEFYQALGRQWQTAPVQALPEFSMEDARRAQRSQRRAIHLHRALGFLSLLVALYFLVLPLSVLTMVAAMTLIATVVLDLWFIRTQQQSLMHWDDWSPEGLMIYRQKLLQAQLRAARYYVWSSIGLLLFTAFLWAYAWLTPELASTGFHLLFSAFSVPVSGVILVYFGLMHRRKKEHLRHVKALLADYAAE